MSTPEKQAPLRILFLITTPKSAEKASALFDEGAVPVQYLLNALGTAPNEMIDILGLGTPDKRVLVSMMPKPFADLMLKKLKKALRLGSVDSGIAFTLPLSGANSIVVRILEQLSGEKKDSPERKDGKTMSDPKHSLIATVINRGFSEEVMDAARAAGATGGTIVHGRRIGNKEALSFWGMSIQEEKELLFIVANSENRLKIMQTIGEKFGMRSEAKGIVLSLPIDSAIGLDDE